MESSPPAISDSVENAVRAKIARHRRRVLMQRIVRRLSSVVGFQIMYYAWFFLSGVYNFFIAHGDPPVTLSHVPNSNVEMWNWLNIIGPLFGTTGIYLERTRFNFPGLFIGIAGNLFFGWSLIFYELATLEAEPWGHGMYGSFLGGAALCSTSSLILRDGLRIQLRRSAE